MKDFKFLRNYNNGYSFVMRTNYNYVYNSHCDYGMDHKGSEYGSFRINNSLDNSEYAYTYNLINGSMGCRRIVNDNRTRFRISKPYTRVHSRKLMYVNDRCNKVDILGFKITKASTRLAINYQSFGNYLPVKSLYSRPMNTCGQSRSLSIVNTTKASVLKKSTKIVVGITKEHTANDQVFRIANHDQTLILRYRYKLNVDKSYCDDDLPFRITENYQTLIARYRDGYRVLNVDREYRDYDQPFRITNGPYNAAVIREFSLLETLDAFRYRDFNDEGFRITYGHVSSLRKSIMPGVNTIIKMRLNRNTSHDTSRFHLINSI